MPDPTPPTTDNAMNTDPPAGSPPAAGTDTTKLQAALDAERRARRDAEKAAKTHADELDRLRQSTMNDNEKAIATARAEAAAEAEKAARVRYGSLIVTAEVRAAAAGRPVDVDALVEAIDVTRFLNDDGTANVAAITAWVDKVAPKTTDDPKLPGGFPDLGQGERKRADQVALNDPLLRDLVAKVGPPR